MSAELASLAAQCTEVDSLAAPPAAAPVPVTPPGPPPPAPELVGEIKMLVQVARPIAELLLPYLKGAEAAAWEALIEPIAGLMQHYGVSPGALVTNPWGRLGIAAIPLGAHAFSQYQAASAKKEGQGAEAPAPVTVPEPAEPAIVLQRG